MLATDAPKLFVGLAGRALPLVVLSGIAGLAGLWLLWSRRYLLARVGAAVAVTALLWSWALAQYPVMLEPATTVAASAAPPSVLAPTLIALAVGSALLIPSLCCLYSLSQHPHGPPAARAQPVRRPAP